MIFFLRPAGKTHTGGPPFPAAEERDVKKETAPRKGKPFRGGRFTGKRKRYESGASGYLLKSLWKKSAIFWKKLTIFCQKFEKKFPPFSPPSSVWSSGLKSGSGRLQRVQTPS